MHAWRGVRGQRSSTARRPISKYGRSTLDRPGSASGRGRSCRTRPPTGRPGPAGRPPRPPGRRPSRPGRSRAMTAVGRWRSHQPSASSPASAARASPGHQPQGTRPASASPDLRSAASMPASRARAATESGDHHADQPDAGRVSGGEQALRRHAGLVLVRHHRGRGQRRVDRVRLHEPPAAQGRGTGRTDVDIVAYTKRSTCRPAARPPRRPPARRRPRCRPSARRARRRSPPRCSRAPSRRRTARWPPRRRRARSPAQPTGSRAGGRGGDGSPMCGRPADPPRSPRRSACPVGRTVRRTPWSPRPPPARRHRAARPPALPTAVITAIPLPSISPSDSTSLTRRFIEAGHSR